MHLLKLSGVIVVTLSSLMTAACGSEVAPCDCEGAGSGATSSGTTSSGGTSGSGTGGGNTAVGETITLVIEPFDVQPGTERQVCKTVNLPASAPFDVVRFFSMMQGTSHHFNAYKMLNDTSPVSELEGKVHDCGPASEQLNGDAAYIFGAATPERILETPDGVAFHLVPQQKIILEQHVINTTNGVIQGGVTFELSSPAADVVIEHHADIGWFGNWGFYLPASAETSDTASCAVPYDIEVFGLMSHTHALGFDFSIEKWTPKGNTHLYDSYDWAHPPYMELSPTLSLAVGEGLQWTCTWKNTTKSAVGPGKDSTDEMCIAFAAAYPKNTLSGEPFQCNETF